MNPDNGFLLLSLIWPPTNLFFLHPALPPRARETAHHHPRRTPSFLGSPALAEGSYFSSIYPPILLVSSGSVPVHWQRDVTVTPGPVSSAKEQRRLTQQLSETKVCNTLRVFSLLRINSCEILRRGAQLSPGIRMSNVNSCSTMCWPHKPVSYNYSSFSSSVEMITEPYLAEL